MKRILAQTSNQVSYRVYYGAPFARKTKKFNNKQDMYQWLESNIFLPDGGSVRVEEVREIDVDDHVVYMNHYDIKDKALSRRLFETGIISRGEQV